MGLKSKFLLSEWDFLRLNGTGVRILVVPYHEFGQVGVGKVRLGYDRVIIGYIRLGLGYLGQLN